MMSQCLCCIDFVESKTVSALLLLYSILTQISNQPITWQHRSAFRNVKNDEDGFLKFKADVRMGKKLDLSDFVSLRGCWSQTEIMQ